MAWPSNENTDEEESMTGSKSKFVCLAAIAVLVGAAVAAHGAYEVRYYITDDYTVDARCTPKNNLDFYDVLQDYRAEMTSWGWSATQNYDTVYPWFFFDPDLMSPGYDMLAIDGGTIGFVTAHGGVWPSDNFFWQLARYDSQTGHCKVTPENHMELGDYDGRLMFLHTVACRSMHIDDNVFRSWRDVFHGIHQIHGFHGLGWNAVEYSDSYGDFADHSHNSSVATNWVLDLYWEDFRMDEGTWTDQCPVAYTGRDSLIDCANVLNNEKYPIPNQNNIVFPDEYSPTYWST